jgi:BirA family biotin operon repressor/biotin-[acetyl-CoA-carboxylase] ligase
LALPPDYKPLGSPFIELQSVDSTNNYARQLIKSANEAGKTGKELHGTAIFTYEQPAGKGQRGKTWHSEKEANILISLIIDPRPLTLTNQFDLVCCIFSVDV